MNAPTRLTSYALGRWLAPAPGPAVPIAGAVTGEVVAEAAGGDAPMRAILDHARQVGGPALRRLTFHARAEILKRLAQHLTERKEVLYRLSHLTGATRGDAAFDVDGGIGALFVYASKARRELPNDTFLIDGPPEALSRGGTFAGQHVMTPLQGVAVHINAFNFPIWGPLEKFAPAFVAGVPVVTKPATVTAYVTEALVRLVAESGLLPDGALQLVVGSTGDLFDHLTGQDVVAFTGSAATAQTLQRHPVIAREAVRFVAERDSLNAAILGPDAGPGTPEFDLFVREVRREMSIKAGQKCTAIRRALVPAAHLGAATEALRRELAGITIGDPAREDVRMGPVVGLDQRRDVLEGVARLREEAEVIVGAEALGDPEALRVEGADARRGAFLPPILLHCPDPIRARAVHGVEAFGPVATLMPYEDGDGGVEAAVALANRGEGSLVASLYTHEPAVARAVAFGAGSFHGRLVLIDRDCAKEQTGHGAPPPHMVHGGPGRAGGGEELGGLRALHHYLQRTALQGSPAMLAGVTGQWLRGAPEVAAPRHPFRYAYDELSIGQTFRSGLREVTLEDVEHFARFTGDTFYAHMDEEAVRGHPFFPGRVAHGYLLLSFAAGLFVDPDPGPVLANYGLDNLRFLKPVQPGEQIGVRLTAKHKSPRNAEYGEVRWDVEIANGAGETAATYELLTMNARAGTPFASQGASRGASDAVGDGGAR